MVLFRTPNLAQLLSLLHGEKTGAWMLGKSANRASSLHKRRTGKAFHVTKEIVEGEGMYEEVDERYQAKRILMLQNRTLRIKE
ncbi:hypothetical protein E8E15_000579 [Penicillium rubens]|nr:hypothetical protein E8E15_000579 [Penicillium rubens]KAJ5849303.1 hypothetical protein N7534_007992 [Penicillium rubens]